MQDIPVALIRLDLLFDTVSGIIAFLIAHQANRAFKLTKQKRLSDLSTGFLVLSAAMFERVIGTFYFFVYLGLPPPSEVPFAPATIMIDAYGFMKIMAFLLFAVSMRRTGRVALPQASVALMALPVLIDLRLEFVAVIILIVVVLQAVLNYLEVRSRFALYVAVGFLLLLGGHLALMLAQNELRGYLIGQLLQVLGFIALLVMLIKAGREP
jgi:hypothetical protein